ncbi:MAG: VOC family protein [Deltaproteobacteria bacterium]
MENLISGLLDDFERGKLTRRQLIQCIAAAAAATTAAGASVPKAGAGKGFKAIAVNHISYQVADHAKTRDFYAGLLDLEVLKDTGSQCFLKLNDSNTFLIPRNAPAGVTPPRVDHIALTIADWDAKAVGAELERRGLKPKADTENSFHIADPNGYDLQICGEKMTAYTG